MKPLPHPLPPVVIVDNEPDDLFLLSERLRRARIPNSILTFDRATDAVGFLKTAFLGLPTTSATEAPCIVITDVKMPGLDGFQLTGWIRAHPELASVPIIVLSGANDPRDTARALQLGANAYFAKFPRAEALATIISRASRPRPPG